MNFGANFEVISINYKIHTQITFFNYLLIKRLFQEWPFASFGCSCTVSFFLKVFKIAHYYIHKKRTYKSYIY